MRTSKSTNITSERIKLQREALGLSQIQLADAVGVGRGSIWSWESDGKIPRQSTLLKLIAVLQTTTDYLLGATDDPSPRLTSTEIKSSTSDRPPWADELFSELRALKVEMRKALQC